MLSMWIILDRYVIYTIYLKMKNNSNMDQTKVYYTDNTNKLTDKCEIVYTILRACLTYWNCNKLKFVQTTLKQFCISTLILWNENMCPCENFLDPHSSQCIKKILWSFK